MCAYKVRYGGLWLQQISTKVLICLNKCYRQCIHDDSILALPNTYFINTCKQNLLEINRAYTVFVLFGLYKCILVLILDKNTIEYQKVLSS